MNDYSAQVISNKAVGLDGKELVVSIDNPPAVRGGQFAMLETGRADLILRRPLGVSKVDGNKLSFIYQIKGGGTNALATLCKGDKLQIALPLGKPFELGGAKRVAIVGGGYGVIPLLLTAAQSAADKYIYNGFSCKQAVMCEKEFVAVGRLTVCTDDGSYGVKGYPTAALEADFDKIKPDLIICCGPNPLMRAAKELGARKGIKTLLSLEQRMGCGVGACLVCTCKAGGENKRVCADGPVFDAAEVTL